jgi:hypothetical protein
MVMLKTTTRASKDKDSMQITNKIRKSEDHLEQDEHKGRDN